jgi:transcriptional regulator with XRE-family HTH domain
MNTHAITARITERLSNIGMTAQSASVAAGGSKDMIRNWQRARQAGKPFSIQIKNLEGVARALQVSMQWLLTGSDDDSAAPQFADDARPFTPAAPQEQAVRALYAQAAKHPQILVCMSIDLPGLGLQSGDLLITDLGREPVDGDIVAVTQYRDGNSTTLLRRLLSPWLLACDPGLDKQPMRADDPDVTLRYPVIGLVRGLSPD